MSDIAVPALYTLDGLQQLVEPVPEQDTSNVVDMTERISNLQGASQSGKQASTESTEEVKKKKRTQFTSCDACVRVYEASFRRYR